MRDYIETLRAAGQLRVIRREVDPAFELAAVIQRSQEQSDDAVLFERVKGTALPVVANVYGSYRRMCDIIGTEYGGFCRRWHELTDAGAASAPRAAGPAPDPQVEEGRLSDLPQVRYFERDGGAYLTAAVFLAKDPDSGIANLSFCRSMMVSDAELRVRLAPPHDLAQYQARAEARDEPLEVAILLGPPPEVFLGACASVPIDADEMELAARLRGAPIPMRPCKTIDLEVPVETEIVIEGRILPHERRPEGPFGEFLGYYVAEGPNHVFEITRVCWRPGAVFHALLCGHREDLQALEIAFASRAYRYLVGELPGILDVSCNPSPLHTIVRIRKEYENHPRDVIARTIESHPRYNKIVIVVDEDVNIHDFQDVWWAVVTRCRVDRKLTIVPDMPGFYRDEAKVYHGRLGIDATKPAGFESEFERKRVPGVEDIDLARYLDKKKGSEY